MAAKTGAPFASIRFQIDERPKRGGSLSAIPPGFRKLPGSPRVSKMTHLLDNLRCGFPKFRAHLRAFGEGAWGDGLYGASFAAIRAHNGGPERRRLAAHYSRGSRLESWPVDASP